LESHGSLVVVQFEFGLVLSAKGTKLERHERLSLLDQTP